MKSTAKSKMYIEMHRRMLQIRHAESRVVKMFLSGMIPGFLHSYLGQEAVAVGACFALEERDLITSTHRGHGHLIAKGGKIDRMMAELFGKETGFCKGKGGSMHIADVSLGIVGANGIVGAGLPIANGVALSSQMRETDEVTLCFFGDGAANQGSFHEALNLGSIWSLPLVYICENNLYAMSTPQSYHSNVEHLAERSKAYGIPGVVADGNEVLDVYEKTKKAVKRARSGKGPTLIECQTYRKLGHYVGDPTVYRTKEEEAEWEARDPILLFGQYLTENGVADQAGLDRIEQEVIEEIDAAVEFAKNSPYPEAEEAMQHVFNDWKWGDEYQ
jgi:pyruvate dehydrogenase E1 component alpha subunit